MRLDLLPADPDARRTREEFLHVVTGFLTVITFIVTILHSIFQPAERLDYYLAIDLPAFALSFGAWLNSRAGYRYVPSAVHLLCVILAVVTAGTAFLHIGRSVAETFLGVYVILIFVIGVYFSLAAAAVTATLSIVEYGALLTLEAKGVLQYAPLRPAYQTAVANPDDFITAFFNVAVVNISAFVLAVFMQRALQRQRYAVDRARLAAEEANQRKDEFLSSVSHELRTPLTSVIGYAEYMEQARRTLSPDRERRYLRTIIQEATRLLRLINEILEVQKFTQGMVVYRKTAVNLGNILQDVTETLSPLVAEAQLTVVSSIPHDLPLVWADPDRLTQVFTNLVGNAVKFSPAHGTIRVSVQFLRAARDRPSNASSHEGLHHRAQRDSPPHDALLVEIADEGRGIPPDMLEAVFERFQQVSREDADKEKGVGLGLSIAREIIAQHGGRIWAEQRTPTGATFCVWLPATPAPQRPE